MRKKHSVAKTALSMGLSVLMVMGGISAQAIAEVASSQESQESLSNQEALEPTEEVLANESATSELIEEPPAKEPADVVIQVQDQGSAEATEGESATELPEVETQGDASPEEVVGIPQTFEFDFVQQDEDNDRLFEEYARQQFEGALPQREQDDLLATQSVEEGLSAHGLKIYEALMPMLKEVAAGTRTSTEFTLDLSDLGIGLEWTAAELGYASTPAGTFPEGLLSAATNLALEDIGWQSLVSSWKHNAADLYWISNKGVAVAPTFRLANRGGQSWVGVIRLTFRFKVSKNYSATGQEDTTDVNPSAASSVQTALSRAQGIVDQNKNKGTYNQMLAYKNAICNLTSLNSSADTSAASGNYPQGFDPWQIIWVFDGNSSTNVTSAGYAKAFQYLCDLSNFSDAECIFVSGTQYKQDFNSGGSATTSSQSQGLAWNVVRVEDGRSYLVDVANCDSGMDGNPDLLFLQPPTSGSYAGGYVFSKSLGSGNTRRLTYVYNSDTKQLYGENALTLASSSYATSDTLTFVNYEPNTNAEYFVSGTYDGKSHTIARSDRDYVLTGTVTAKDAGVYTVWARPKVGYCWNDSTVAPKELKWAILPKAVTVTPNNKTKQMGEADPTFDATASGLVSGDTGSRILCTFERTAGETPGTYTIRANGNASQGNYKVTFGTGTLTITPAPSNAVAASGLWGTCPWKLYGDGRLVIDPGTGANTVDNKSPWADYAELITSVTVGTKTGGRVIGPANCSYLFCDMSKMKSFDGSGFDCYNVTSIKGIFKNCMQLSDISGISMWDTARVQNMDSAFDDCMRIQTLDLSGWDTRSVTSSGEIFPFCRPKTFAIGEKYRMSMWADEYTVRQTIPYAPAPPDSWLDYSSSWWSTRDGKYYGVNEIMSNRMGIADVYTSEQPSAGWARVSTTWYYYDEDGESHKGWLKSGDKWYYLDPATGAMKTGWQSVGGKWYLLASSGHMLTGWQKVGSTWYYLNSSGAMQTGWIKLGSTWYYLKASGAMATGWCKVGSTWYYLNSSGAMQTGWIKLGNTWYYLKASGAMATGWLQLGSTWYYFNGSGAMVTGRQNIGGKWYTFNASGAWVD